MGMNYPFGHDIDAAVQMRKLDRESRKVRMRRLSKAEATTWWDSSHRRPPSDLDHVVGAEHLR